MGISIICLGKTKEGYIRDGIQEFLKRLNGQVKIEEYAEEKGREVSENLKKEGDRLIRHMQKGYGIALDERGKQMTSLEFAAFLKKHEMEQLVLVIGSAEGLSDAVRKEAKETIAIGKMTWTHQMVRLLLLEQIYRGTCINKGIPYHR